MKTKICSKCKKRKLIKYYCKRNGRPCGVQSRCKKCFRPYNLGAYQKLKRLHPEKIKEKYRHWYYSPKGDLWRRKQTARKYKLTVEQYDAQLEKQKGLCAICKDVMKPPHVDHDHKTNHTREFLCRACNHMLGSAYDSIIRLKKAIKYLRKHEDK